MPGDPPLPQYPQYSGSENYPPPEQWATGRPDRKKAGWALGLSIVPCGFTIIVGAILAISVLVASRDGRDNGKKMAIAALCVCAAWVVLIAGLIVVAIVLEPERDSEGQLTESGTVLASELKLGDCLPNTPDLGTTGSLDVVPCKETHLGEVFYLYDVPEFTNKDEVAQQVSKACSTHLDDYAEPVPGRPGIQIYVISPQDEEGFEDDPGAVCLAYTLEPRTSSLRTPTA